MTKWGGSPHKRLGGHPLGTDVHGSWWWWRTRAGRPYVLLVPAAGDWVAYWDFSERAALYVDVCADLRWVDGHVEAHDMDLDVVRLRSGEVTELDRDEFEEHRIRYGYPDHVAEAADRLSADLLARVRGEVGPFDGAHEPWLAMARAIAAVDDANGSDPRSLDLDGSARPRAQAEGIVATRWAWRLAGPPSPALQLAVRAHHLRRWELPRTAEAPGRAGYLRWRRRLYDLQGDALGALLAGCDVTADVADRAVELVRKRGIGPDGANADPEAQTYEDALCLTFLSTSELPELVESLADERAVEVLRRTARKMSAPALELATTIPLPAREAELLRTALAATG